MGILAAVKLVLSVKDGAWLGVAVCVLWLIAISLFVIRRPREPRRGSAFRVLATGAAAFVAAGLGAIAIAVVPGTPDAARPIAGVIALMALVLGFVIGSLLPKARVWDRQIPQERDVPTD